MKHRAHPVLRRIRNLFLCVLAVCFLAAGAVVIRGYYMYTSALERLPIAAAARQIRDAEGFTPIDSLPATYLTAVVSVEDHRFYDHGGVDYLAIARAAYNDICTLSLREGGSTITQQLAKNIYFSQEQEFTRKVAEIFMAWYLESELTKDEILELYVNCIYFGSGCYSVGDASRCYFGKEPAAMSDWECTLLAGIPNAPSAYDYNENPGLAVQRQRQVVAMMEKHGGLTQEQARLILDGTSQSGGVALCAQS